VIRIEEKNGCVSFNVRVQPRASRTELAGEHDGAIKLRISAPPVDNKANEECKKFLAKLLDVASNAVEIIQGESSRSKVIRVRGVTAEQIYKSLNIDRNSVHIV
jgi:uncharacterized protein (TIGR00251 family)